MFFNLYYMGHCQLMSLRAKRICADQSDGDERRAE